MIYIHNMSFIVIVLGLLSYIPTNARVKKRSFKKAVQPIELNEKNVLEEVPLGGRGT